MNLGLRNKIIIVTGSTQGSGEKYTTYDTTYYSKDGKKVTGVTEEDTGKIQKEGSRRFVTHEDGRKQNHFMKG